MDIGIITKISNLNSWLMHNQNIFFTYIINVVFVVVISITGMFLARFVSKMTNSIMTSHNIDVTIVNFLTEVVYYSIMIFTWISVLEKIGIQTASIIAVLGAAGLAVGLALQGSLSNLASGMLLIIFRPFRSGEYVTFSKVSGYVINVQIFSTILRTLDGKILVVPNSRIINGNIINFSREPIRRNEWVIRVSYDSNIDKVKQLLRKIINSDDRILKEKDITIRLNELGSSSINFIIRAWSKNIDLMNVYWDILETIKQDFDANNINFSYSHKSI